MFDSLLLVKDRRRAARYLWIMVVAFLFVAVFQIPDALSQSSSAPTFDLVIDGGRLADGRTVVKVTEGDRVTLRWTSAKPIELHLHGYDIEAKVTPREPTTMTFEAFATGRFPIALHGSGHHDKTILYVEVHPR